ncbi:hypothetical protein [uncultured Ramlibacter sp.]|uniref:hypothetical protein n=1 Tax=uncultured Ramlibacter sp. TaxID=260755 RepID=UPI0026101CB6|nr:hypothetical protein [uncultured Ramlibacter sp.]
MSTSSKIMGLLAGVSAVAVIGVAVAQGVEPDARITNPAIGAGQQSSQDTAMGETGVPSWEKLIPTAAVVTEPVVAAVEPAPVAAAEPPQQATMGAAPAEPVVVAEAPARADRN